MGSHRLRRAVTAGVVTMVLLTACGDDDDTAPDTAAGSTTSETTEAPSSSSASTAATSDPGELPGEEIDIFPYEGAEMAVVGVAADDVLNVRAGPGVDFDIVVSLDPLSDGEAVATGNNRRLDSGAFWAELEVDGETGWANTAFLLQAGVVDDVTTALFPAPADRPSAETLEDLARAVAERVASEEPASEITIVDGPSVGDLGEVTVDVIGVGDDSIGGFRLHIFAEEGPDEFTVRSVEQTTMCSRGVDDSGLCL